MAQGRRRIEELDHPSESVGEIHGALAVVQRAGTVGEQPTGHGHALSRNRKGGRQRPYRLADVAVGADDPIPAQGDAAGQDRRLAGRPFGQISPVLRQRLAPRPGYQHLGSGRHGAAGFGSQARCQLSIEARGPQVGQQPDPHVGRFRLEPPHPGRVADQQGRRTPAGPPQVESGLGLRRPPWPANGLVISRALVVDNGSNVRGDAHRASVSLTSVPRKWHD
jgi:hypothetical protein